MVLRRLFAPEAEKDAEDWMNKVTRNLNGLWPLPDVMRFIRVEQGLMEDGCCIFSQPSNYCPTTLSESQWIPTSRFLTLRRGRKPSLSFPLPCAAVSLLNSSCPDIRLFITYIYYLFCHFRITAFRPFRKKKQFRKATVYFHRFWLSVCCTYDSHSHRTDFIDVSFISDFQ